MKADFHFYGVKILFIYLFLQNMCTFFLKFKNEKQIYIEAIINRTYSFDKSRRLMLMFS